MEDNLEHAAIPDGGPPTAAVQLLLVIQCPKHRLRLLTHLLFDLIGQYYPRPPLHLMLETD